MWLDCASEAPMMAAFSVGLIGAFLIAQVLNQTVRPLGSIKVGDCSDWEDLAKITPSEISKFEVTDFFSQHFYLTQSLL